MCGRFSNRFTWKELHDLYQAFLGGAPSTWRPRYNIAPTDQIPVIRFIGGARRIDLMRWGLVPAWAKDVGGFATHNARDDGFTTKPAFRDAWRKGRRCIVPASSFYEWRKTDKQPFAIGLGDGTPLGFAGLWDEWVSPDGEVLLSCTIITTAPNALMGPIHDRMPVILAPEQWPAWLGEIATREPKLLAMLTSYAAERMKSWPVDKRVGNVRHQDDKLDTEIPPPLL
jgi:putative SOS response-associated peptidase YedK